jgi:hypothetical protein
MSVEVFAVQIFSKYVNKISEFLFNGLLRKISKKKFIWIKQEDKEDLASGLRAATSSIRYALKNQNCKRQLKFGVVSDIDVFVVSDWLSGYFLDFYYASLNEKIKKQIKIINDLQKSMDVFYCYTYSFFDGTADTAYSERYQHRCRDAENTKKGKDEADKIFDITLPYLLKSYIDLTKLFQKQGIID